MEFGIQYDLRNPSVWQRPNEVHYSEFLDQVEWADRYGFDYISLPEHHFSPDGYVPCSVTVGAAVAARTRNIRIEFCLILLPLKHPVQLAEQLALVDIISNGRIEVQFGTGYRPEEYDGYGINMKTRKGRSEEAIEIIKKCWTEGSFDFDGRYWQLRDVRMEPKPVQKPRPKIILGGASPASAIRAAQQADGYNPITPKMHAIWRDEMIRLGKDPGPEFRTNVPRPPGLFLFVARDPDEAWRRVGKYALHANNSYADYAGNLKHAPYQQARDPAELLARGTHGVMTPQQLVELGKRMQDADPDGANIRISPLVGGLPASESQECLSLIVQEVMPHFR